MTVHSIVQAPGFSCPAPEGFYTMSGGCDSEYYLCLEGIAYYQVTLLNSRIVFKLLCIST